MDPRKHQEVQLPQRDHGANLLITSERATQQLRDPEVELRFEQRSRRADGEQLVLRQDLFGDLLRTAYL